MIAKSITEIGKDIERGCEKLTLEFNELSTQIPPKYIYLIFNPKWHNPYKIGASNFPEKWADFYGGRLIHKAKFDETIKNTLISNFFNGDYMAGSLFDLSDDDVDFICSIKDDEI